MVDVGILAIGPEAAAMRYRQFNVPVEVVAAEPVRPLDEDLDSLVVELGRSLFGSGDGERWMHVPAKDLAAQTDMLWATSQIASEDPGRRVHGWKRVLIVAWADEPALVPTLRTLPEGVLVTVLLGGRARRDDPAVRRNLTVLADRCRRNSVVAIIHNSEPQRVVEVALETALNPTLMDYPRPPAVDIGSPLAVDPVYVFPEPEVPLFGLVHVPLGMAQQVPTLMRDLAARAALHGLLHGPPVEVEGVPVLDLEALRETLPSGDVFDVFRNRLMQVLEDVRFRGEEPLVEGIARALRPLQAQIVEIAQTAAAIESHRILRMRAFGAAGIHYTAHRLRAQLDDVAAEPAVSGAPELHSLLGGTLAPTPAGVHPLAWRQVFAGVPSYVVRRGQPGWQVARELVIDRFSRFKGEFASAVANALERSVRRARDPRSPLPTPALRELHHRAERVRDALDGVVTGLDGRILAGSEIALRQDGLLRWVTSDPEQFREKLQRLVARHVVSVELERAATVALTRRPLGMADPIDFEAYLDEVVDGANGLAQSASVVPDYESVLMAFLSERDASELRAHLTDDEGIDPLLFIRKNTSAELIDWFTATGMRVEVQNGDPCAIYWRSASDLTGVAAEPARQGTTEHQLADLVLPAPDGDDVRLLCALAESTALILAGLAVGELGLARAEGSAVLVLRDAGLPGLPFLPYGAIQGLAVDPAVRDALRGRVARRLDRLAASVNASEALQKLVELSTLGPSARVRTQLGLDNARLGKLLPVVNKLLDRFAERATIAMIEHSRSDEVRALIEPPTEHAVRDLLQLAPLGA